MASSFIRLCAPLGAFLLSSLAAQAASLGPLQVHSRLGQGFVADIEVTGEKAELDGFSVNHVAPEAYLKSGLDYEPAIRNLQFSVERQSDTRAVVRLRSESGFNLPIGNLLLDARWPGGSMQRDYTFLLDPPEALMRVTAAGATAQPVAPITVEKVAEPATAAVPVTVSPTKAASKPVAQAAAKPQAKSELKAEVKAEVTQADSGEYRTQAGDSLDRVARQNKPGSASRMQTMAAIYQANPEAFVQGDASRMRRGALIKLPDESAALKLDEAAARKLIVSSAGGFDAHRKEVALAAQQALASEGEATRSAAGRIAPVVEEPAPQQAAGRLHIGQGKGSAAARKRIEALEEEIASKSKALEEQNSRIQELQATMDQLNTLLAMQQPEASAPAADASATLATSAPAAEPAAITEVQAPAEPTAAPVKAEAPVMRNVRQPDNWYEDTAVQTLALFMAGCAAAWLAYRRYRERKWREADREMQRQRGMPVDESVLSLA